MNNTKEKYMVVVDHRIVKEGTFKECVRYVRDLHWAVDAIQELLILKVVANGKEI